MTVATVAGAYILRTGTSLLIAGLKTQEASAGAFASRDCSRSHKKVLYNYSHSIKYWQ